MSTDHQEIFDIAADFTRVEGGRRFPEARLVEPTNSGYLVAAAAVDRRPMFLPSSRAKRSLIRRLQRLLGELRTDERVVDAVAFDGLIAPPGRGEILKDRPDVPVARFDVAVFVEVSNPEVAKDVERGDGWRRLVRALEAGGSRHYTLRARNVRSMGQVDHARDGVFLFNYFYADRTDLNLAAWQYTAGWFRDQTGLDNSTVLLPEETSEPRYRLINHTRWDRLSNVLPSLLFKRSFRTYVLEHFRLNGVAAMPVLYRMITKG